MLQKRIDDEPGTFPEMMREAQQLLRGNLEQIYSGYRDCRGKAGSRQVA